MKKLMILLAIVSSLLYSCNVSRTNENIKKDLVTRTCGFTETGYFCKFQLDDAIVTTYWNDHDEFDSGRIELTNDKFVEDYRNLRTGVDYPYFGYFTFNYRDNNTTKSFSVPSSIQTPTSAFIRTDRKTMNKLIKNDYGYMDILLPVFGYGSKSNYDILTITIPCGKFNKWDLNNKTCYVIKEGD